MTPPARISAAIAILDRVLAGEAAERVLTVWARGNRFAGSKDRAAIRDLVFAALRRLRSLAWLGGMQGSTPTGRALMIGLCRAEGTDPATLFTGQGHASAPLTAVEGPGDLTAAPDALRYDQPDWFWPLLGDSLGPQRNAVARVLQQRAAVFLRVNTARCDRATAAASLAAEGVAARPHPDVATALEVTDGAARIRTTTAYLGGLVELQDAASQAAVLRLPLADGQRILDYCAGGGGKSLAMAARAAVAITAHDALAGRMADLPARAVRAGAAIAIRSTAALDCDAGFDLVLVDAPCSGSGTWRRAPEARWRLTPQGLAGLLSSQATILTAAARHVAPGGWLAYATCSVLRPENQAQIAAFIRSEPDWQVSDEMSLLPGPLHDGFYMATLRKVNATTTG